MDIEPILAYSFLGNTVKQYAISAGIFIITYVVLSLFKFVVIKKLKKLALKTKTEIDDLLVQILDNIHWPFYSFMSLFVASQYLQLHPFASRILSYIFIIVSGYYVVKALQDLIKYGTSSIIKKQQETDAAMKISRKIEEYDAVHKSVNYFGTEKKTKLKTNDSSPTLF